VRVRAPLAALAAVLTLAGCGGGGGGGATPDLKVSAAASLKSALTAYAATFSAAHVRLSFGGSDVLAAQIRQGARFDVYAAANAKLPDALYAQHLVERPVPFARNRLVLAVPAGSSARGLRDLERRGRRLAIGSATVPIGSYTDQVLARLDPSERALVLANVRSREPDVTGIVGKLTQGAVDGGFVYITDVRATKGALRAIDLPAALQPRVVYEAAVVRGGDHTSRARAFIDGLLHGRGASELRAAGFEPPPP
jgi:molybdate transport system substrate-binding protein